MRRRRSASAGSPSSRRCRDPGRVDEPGEDVVDILGSRRVPCVDTKKLAVTGVGHHIVTAVFVVTPAGNGGRVQEQSAGLAELRVLDHQRLGVQIDPVAIEAAGLAGAHPCHRKQPDQRCPGRGPQRLGQLARGLDQRVDLGRRIQVRGDPVLAVRQPPRTAGRPTRRAGRPTPAGRVSDNAAADAYRLLHIDTGAADLAAAFRRCRCRSPVDSRASSALELGNGLGDDHAAVGGLDRHGRPYSCRFAEPVGILEYFLRPCARWW